ncbi:MAG: succinyl-diaminopimelate desuccinylase [Xanthomonadales bacterium]|jgi:succinyl-diaminopimelate desuccinylase|nr:succinyl-diaminopimelate desuccinylase [Xanthomonadales bacterium]
MNRQDNGDSPLLALAQDLVRRRSVTPDDGGCQAIVAERLRASGFTVESLDSGDVANLWCWRSWGEGPVFMFLGHTDVVPSGPAERWRHPPFDAVIADGYLHGRGSADMKGSVAAMVCALENIAQSAQSIAGTVGLLLTSDEEGDAILGVRHVVKIFKSRGQHVDFCLVGEPSSSLTLGDVVRIGRRGSLTATVDVRGVQGHVAYPDKAVNPIHAVLPILSELQQRNWDGDEPYPEFPPTSFQIANFNAGTGASNVIPGNARVQFNLRYSPRWNAQNLIDDIEALFLAAGVEAAFDWHRSGEPFHTSGGILRNAVRKILAKQCGITPEENTGGGTSDGRFIATMGAEIVELGPINSSIHQIDECVAVQDLLQLQHIYQHIARDCLSRNA